MVTGPGREIGRPASTRSRAASTRRCTAASLWTMRMFAGFGTPEDTNRRFKLPARAGPDRPLDRLRHADADGLRPRPPAVARARSAARASRSPRSDDMERLFDGIPLDEVTTSMTINAPAIVALALYVAVAEQQGVPPAQLRGTIQNDMLKEFIAQKEWIVPERPVDAHHRRHDRVLHRRDAALEHGLDQRLPHPRGGRDGGAGAGLHARRRHRLRRELRGARASTSTSSRRGSRSSSTCTTTSSRRSPSSARRGACGRA